MEDHVNWYRNQVVFLTGSTGYLGACLLYKLSVQLPTCKVFALCRASVQNALTKLENLFPDQLDDILDTRKVHFIVGDISQPNWGLRPSDLQRLAEEVTVVLHAAAETSIFTTLPDVVQANYMSIVSLLDFLRSFHSLQTLLYVSSAFVNVFVQEPVIREELYPLFSEKPDIHPQDILTSITGGGELPPVEKLPNPYILSKYLAEKALLHQSENLPFSLLIVRPSLISPAIRDPYPFYAVANVTPVYAGLRLIMTNRDYGLERLQREIPPDAVVDEIPVDLVASTSLAHLALGTKGIIHATGELYVRITAYNVAMRIVAHAPQGFKEQVLAGNGAEGEAMASYVFENIKQYCISGRTFDCQRSMQLKGKQGPLGLKLEGHDPDSFARQRIERSPKALHSLLEHDERLWGHVSLSW